MQGGGAGEGGRSLQWGSGGCGEDGAAGWCLGLGLGVAGFGYERAGGGRASAVWTSCCCGGEFSRGRAEGAGRARARRAADEDPVCFQAAFALEALEFLGGARGRGVCVRVGGRMFWEEVGVGVGVGEVAGYRGAFSVVGARRVFSFDDVLPHIVLGWPHLKAHSTAGVEAAKGGCSAEIPHLARHAAEDVEDGSAPSIFGHWGMVGSSPAVTLTRQRGWDVWEVAVLLGGSNAAFAIAAPLV